MASNSKNTTISEMNLLKMIPADLKIFDNISVSSAGQESDLSGPFSDFDKSEPFIEKRKSQDLRNTDIYSYYSFSQEFISAMESVKNEAAMSETKNDSEEIAQVETPVKESQILLDLEKKVKDILKDRYAMFAPQKKNKVDDEDKSGSKAGSVKSNRKAKLKDEKSKLDEDEGEYFDTMSGYWRMLSAYDDFKISPPDYNAYQNEVPHWLETRPIPFQVTETCRTKCLEWLKENFENY